MSDTKSIPSLKASAFRSEFRTIKGKNGNYLMIRFWDGNNWEYHAYAEVIAKQAARDVAKELGVELNDKKKSEGGDTVREFWDQIWEEKLTLQKLDRPK